MKAECITFHEMLMDSLDGALTPERQALFDAHMLGCPECVARMKDYVVVREAARAAKETVEEAYPALPERLVAKILAARRSDGGFERGVVTA